MTKVRWFEFFVALIAIPVGFWLSLEFALPGRRLKNRRQQAITLLGISILSIAGLDLYAFVHYDMQFSPYQHIYHAARYVLSAIASLNLSQLSSQAGGRNPENSCPSPKNSIWAGGPVMRYRELKCRGWPRSEGIEFKHRKLGAPGLAFETWDVEFFRQETSFTCDSENHMMTMTATGTSVTMIYDGDGNRVGKTVNGVTTYYLVDDLNPTGYPQVVEELSSAGTVERQYTYGLQRIDEEQQIANVWTPSFYGYDGGGNVRQLTNAAGGVTDTYEYDAFGNALQTSGSTPNNYLYRGEQYDPDLGLYYLRARYYDPATGRFMSRDPNTPRPFSSNGIPTDPKYLHNYLYANGDPVNLIDPRGRNALIETIVTFPNRIFIYTQYYVPTFIGTLQFYGTIAAAISTAIGWGCEVSGGCGPQPVDPGPGPFEPDGPPPVEPGGAGAQH